MGLGVFGGLIGLGSGYVGAIVGARATLQAAQLDLQAAQLHEDREDARAATGFVYAQTLAVVERGTPEPSGTATWAPSPSRVALNEYYTLLMNGETLEAWGMLSDDYRLVENPAGYEAYAAYWNATPFQYCLLVQVYEGELEAGYLIVLTYLRDNTQREYFVVRRKLDGNWRLDSEEAVR